MDLRSELPCGRDDDGGDVMFLGGFLEAQNALDDGEQKGNGFPTAGNGLREFFMLEDICLLLTATALAELWPWNAMRDLTSTTTSLFPMKCGIVAACTGVICGNPRVWTASKIHCASGGVRASQPLGFLLRAAFAGAMAVLYGKSECWNIRVAHCFGGDCAGRTKS